MSRKWRWFINGTTLLSLLLCAATLALWVRSESVPAVVFAILPTLAAFRWWGGRQELCRRLPDRGNVMRRTLWWVFNGVTVLSLALCVATVTMWVRTRVADRYSLERSWLAPAELRTGEDCMSSYGGELKVFRYEQLWLDRSTYDENVKPPRYVEGWTSTGSDFTFTPHATPPYWERLGFCFDAQTNAFGPFNQRVRGVTFPFWFVLTVLATPPALWLIAAFRGWRRRRRSETRGFAMEFVSPPPHPGASTLPPTPPRDTVGG